MTVLFWLYASAVALITVLPDGVHRNHRAPWWVVVEPVPFHVPPVSFALNIVMFVPLGVLAPRCWPRVDSWPRIAALAFAASTVIESAQFAEWLALGNFRTVDVNDLIANTAGGVLGFALLRLTRRSRRGCSRRVWWRRRFRPPAGSSSTRRGWR